MTTMHAELTQQANSSAEELPDRRTFWGRLTLLGYAVFAAVFVVGFIRVVMLRSAGATLADGEMLVWTFLGGVIVVVAQLLTICTMYRIGLRAGR